MTFLFPVFVSELGGGGGGGGVMLLKIERKVLIMADKCFDT